MNICEKIITITFFIITLSSQAKYVIWDLGDTLMRVDRAYVAARAGIMDCISLYHQYGPECRNLINETIYSVLQSEYEQNGNEKTCCPQDAQGRPVPQLICDWLSGAQPAKTLLREAHYRLDSYKKPLDPRLERIVRNTISMMLDPQKFARSMKPIHRAVRLLRQCARIKDPATGKPKHTMIILSNWDKESFNIAAKRRLNHRLFRHFRPENIFISGELRDVKPHQLIFEYILKRKNIDNPGECIFIDDQDINLQAAAAVGMKTIRVTDGDYSTVKTQLKNFCVI